MAKNILYTFLLLLSASTVFAVDEDSINNTFVIDTLTIYISDLQKTKADDIEILTLKQIDDHKNRTFIINAETEHFPVNDYSLRIVNTLGTQVFENDFHSDSVQIDYTAIRNDDVYFLQIINENNTVVNKKLLFIE